MNLPDTIEVTVTREDAKQGYPCDECHCAIAVSLKRIGYALVSVYPKGNHKNHLFPFACIEDALYDLPLQAIEYADTFDTLEEGDWQDEDTYKGTPLPSDWPEAVTFTLTRRTE